MKYKIVPENISDSNNLLNIPDDRLKRIPFVYLHSELEEKAYDLGGYDIFSFVDEKPTEEGIFECEVMYPDENIDSTLFLWTDYHGVHGLVVSNTDTEQLKFAKEKYDKKSTII